MTIVGSIKGMHLTLNKGGKDNDGDIPDGRHEGSGWDSATLSGTGSVAGTAQLPPKKSVKTTTEGGWPR